MHTRFMIDIPNAKRMELTANFDSVLAADRFAKTLSTSRFDTKAGRLTRYLFPNQVVYAYFDNAAIISAKYVQGSRYDDEFERK